MPLVRGVLAVLGMLIGVAAPLLAQPVSGNEGDVAWWGAGWWILITLVLLVGCILFVVKGIKRPNRR
jgi:hypothetical protein